jgi:hypothetical protein
MEPGSRAGPGVAGGLGRHRPLRIVQKVILYIASSRAGRNRRIPAASLRPLLGTTQASDRSGPGAAGRGLARDSDGALAAAVQVPGQSKFSEHNPDKKRASCIHVGPTHRSGARSAAPARPSDDGQMDSAHPTSKIICFSNRRLGHDLNYGPWQHCTANDTGSVGFNEERERPLSRKRMTNFPSLEIFRQRSCSLYLYDRK